ncbi:MAG: tRNA (N6-threonylcarbamoyladenosine(37)-N6)-methyltransferase TrmO [Aerococcus sp.]|nr:tRNA (N6-threonylcarbamoyladenosine(37)-N6)-methyltransferase TrmO [Aerococcus sp.]
MEIQPIAHIETPFKEKFGIPRQGAVIQNVKGRIVFTPEYRDDAYHKGIQQFERLWLIWGFSLVDATNTKATVRPPRLGGNEKVGVFASRSPFRPNRLGMTCVTLEAIVHDEREGDVLIVSGVDQVDGTPIYDIKPYSPEADAFPDANAGFITSVPFQQLDVRIREASTMNLLSAEEQKELLAILASDPRPAVQRANKRHFGMRYKDFNVLFEVYDGTLTITGIEAQNH